MLGLGGSSTLGIGLIVSLRDEFSGNANRISASIKNLSGNMNKALNNTFNLMGGVGLGMTGLGVAMTMGMKSFLM